MNVPTFLLSMEALATIAGAAKVLTAESAAAVSKAAGSLLLSRLSALPEEFTPRDVYWGGWPGLDSPALASKAIGYLLQQGALYRRGRGTCMPLYAATSGILGRGPTDLRRDLPALVGPRSAAHPRPPSVNYVKARSKWRARGWRDGRRVLLGYFNTREEAEAA